MADKKKGTNDSVKVTVRVRPFNKKEIKEANEVDQDLPTCTLQATSDTMITCINPNNPEDVHNFPFDKVFWSMPPEQFQAPITFADQPSVFDFCGLPSVDSSFDGYNGCIFAYGQTSSGKTHSMMGYPGETGIIPRLCEELFRRIGNEMASGDDAVKTTVTVSFLEIYNEKVLDLLAKREGKGHSFDKALPVIHDPTLGPIVKGLLIETVKSWSEIEKVFERGQVNRSTAETMMNDRSSRSHAIVQISMSRMELYGKVGSKEVRREKRSRINLVDLAGSEKVMKSGVTGAGLKEAIGINQSLSCLGRVIDQLIQTKPGHIPYRDSVLTSLLSDSLGGNSRTTMLAALSPAAVNYEETLSTLRWASRARQVVNVVRVNMDPAQLMIQQLQEELAKYKQALFDGIVAPELQTLAQEKGKAINTVLNAEKENAEAVIAQLKQKEEEEEKQEAAREAKWQEERRQLEEKHEKDLEELRTQHARLQQEQAELKVQHQDLKRKGIIERFKRIGIEGQVQAQKEKQVELEKKAKNDRMKNVVSRIREVSLKTQMKTMEDELQEARVRIQELEAQLESAGNRRPSGVDYAAKGVDYEAREAVQQDGQLMATETSGLGAGGAGQQQMQQMQMQQMQMEQQGFAQDQDQQAGQWTDGSGVPAEQGALCDMCVEHPGLFYCGFPPCNGSILCKDCDADQHRSVKTCHHQRTCIYSNSMVLCEFCGVREAQLICDDCGNAWFCGECNMLKHRSGRWSNHQCHEVTEAEWLARITKVNKDGDYQPSIIPTEHGYMTSIPPNSTKVWIVPNSTAPASIVEPAASLVRAKVPAITSGPKVAPRAPGMPSYVAYQQAAVASASPPRQLAPPGVMSSNFITGQPSPFQYHQSLPFVPPGNNY